MKKKSDDDDLDMTDCLTPKLAAKFTGYSRNTLAKWRVQGKGPKYIKIGEGPASVKYPKAELTAFLAKKKPRLVSSTAEGKMR